jgi:hypothetical protein
MTRQVSATVGVVTIAFALAAGADVANATEPGSFGNNVAGATMGAPLAAAPPPGLYLNNSFFYYPNVTGNGNAGCGDGCKAHYSAILDTVTLTWGSGLKFLGADYAPTISITGDLATSTTTPYLPGGGVGSSPIYGVTQFDEVRNIYVNPINLSWRVGNMPLFVGAGFGFVAPTGTTFAGSTVPDYWTLRPHWAVTYLGDGLNLTAAFSYDINTASSGNTGLYQIIARNPATPAPVSALFSGLTNPGDGYTSGNYLFGDFTATKKFDKWEIGPVAFFKIQTTNDTPGGINPGTGAAWTCAQLTAAKLPSCGRDATAGAGLLIGYNFGPVDVKFIYANAFYARDTIGENTGSFAIVKTSFRFWAPDEPATGKTPLYTKN